MIPGTVRQALTFDSLGSTGQVDSERLDSLGQVPESGQGAPFLSAIVIAGGQPDPFISAINHRRPEDDAGRPARVKDENVGDAFVERNGQHRERLLAGQEAARRRGAGHVVHQVAAVPGSPRVVAAIVAGQVETLGAAAPRASPRRRPGGRGCPCRSCDTATAICWPAWHGVKRDLQCVSLQSRQPIDTVQKQGSLRRVARRSSTLLT